MGRPLRTRLDLLKSNRDLQVLDQQAHQKATHDSHCKAQESVVGESVNAKNFCSGPQWIPRVVSDISGPLTYRVRSNT